VGFARKESYPEIEGAVYDPIAIRKIKKNYCSTKSETTAVLQYVYDHFVTNSFTKEVRYLLSYISAELRYIERNHFCKLIKQYMNGAF